MTKEGLIESIVDKVGCSKADAGRKIQIPAMTVPKFKAGKSLKEAVR